MRCFGAAGDRKGDTGGESILMPMERLEDRRRIYTPERCGAPWPCTRRTGRPVEGEGERLLLTGCYQGWTANETPEKYTG